MIEVKMKNWGPFHNYLKETWAYYDKERKKSLNPYTQFELNTCKTLLVKLEMEYRDYLQTIGADNGRRYMRYLEIEAGNIRKKWRESTDLYMQSAHKRAANVLEEIRETFNQFITMTQEDFKKKYLTPKE